MWRQELPNQCVAVSLHAVSTVTVTSTDPTSGRNDKDTSWPASRNLGNGRLGKISHPDFRQKPGGQVRHSAKITADVPLLDPAMKRDPGRRTKSAKTGGQVVGIRNDRGLVVLSCWVFAKHLSFRRIRRRRRLRNLKLKGWSRFLGLSQTYYQPLVLRQDSLNHDDLRILDVVEIAFPPTLAEQIRRAPRGSGQAGRPTRQNA